MRSSYFSSRSSFPYASQQSMFEDSTRIAGLGLGLSVRFDYLSTTTCTSLDKLHVRAN